MIDNITNQDGTSKNPQFTNITETKDSLKQKGPHDQ